MTPVSNTAFYNAFLLLGHLMLLVICSVYLVIFLVFQKKKNHKSSVDSIAEMC